MQIRKAVITAAGEQQRRIPLQTLVDRDGTERTVLAILLREILTAAIEEVCIVVWPGDEQRFGEAAGEHRDTLRFVHQSEPLGYADALWRAFGFTAGESFLHLVSDHLYVGNHGHGCAAHLVETARREACSISAVRATHERLLTSFGAVGGQPVTGQPGLYHIDTVLEKPTPTTAEQKIIVPGMRAGHYLCFFGMHVLTPRIFDALNDVLRNPPAGKKPTLSDALSLLTRQERYLALQVEAERYDLGSRYGLLISQLALALRGRERDEVLTMLTSFLAADQGREKT